MQQNIHKSGNMPEKKFRAGPITAAVWSNETMNKDGKKVEYKTVSFERNYKDRNDEWKTTSSLRSGDLPRAQLVLSKAFEYLSLSESPAVSQEAV